MKNTRQAAQIAIEARQLANADRPIAVAGSMSHQVPINQGTNKRKQDVLPDVGEARENFIEMAETLADAGVDMIICEMMSDTNLAVPCVEAAVATGLPVWVGLSTDMIDGRLMSHTFHDMPFEEVIDTVLACGGEVAGVMHSKIPTILPAIDLIRHSFTGPVMAYPDSGSFSMPDWQFEGVTTPEAFAAEVEIWKAHGIQVIGGCCGMGVDHIHAMHA